MTIGSPLEPTWTSGAHSAEQLAGDGWFSFSVPAGIVGASVGIGASDLTTEPEEPTHALRFSAGQFYVAESGQRVHPERSGAQADPTLAFANGDVFAIVRHGHQIYYCHDSGAGPVSIAGVPFQLPGAVVYTSTLPALDGPIILDAALLAGGDRVDDAACVPMVGVAISMEPLQLSASETGGAQAVLHFESMALQSGIGAGARMLMEPLQLRASEAATNGVNLLFEPMTLEVREGLQGVRGVYLYMAPMTIEASGAGMSTDRADLAMRPLALFAAESDYAEVRIDMAGLVMFSAAKGHPKQGPYFRGVLPAFQPAAPQPPDTLDVEDVTLAGETLYPSHYTMVIDGAVAGETVVAGATSINLLEDVTLAGEEVMLGTSVLLEDGAIAGDELPPTVSDVLLQDAAWASSEVMAQSDGAVLLEDGALASDAALPYAFADVTDGALAGDDALIATVALLEDAAVADDETLTASLQGPALLEDVAIASDEVTHWTRSVALLQDGAIASEQLFMKTPGLVAWVMNTDTGAVSWYDNWAFTSIAVVGGKVFAAGPDGLHVLGGELDGAETIDARMQFGYAEFGGYDQGGMPKPNEQKKRLGGLWFGYHAGGELAATVETYGQGYGPYTYAMAARAADQPRNNRIVPGKGLNARYWRIAVANTDGCDFEVHSIAAEVAASNRRI